MYIRNLPPRIKEIFHSVCVRRGDTMTDVITVLMVEYLRHPEDFPVTKRFIDGLYDGSIQLELPP